MEIHLNWVFLSGEGVFLVNDYEFSNDIWIDNKKRVSLRAQISFLILMDFILFENGNSPNRTF